MTNSLQFPYITRRQGEGAHPALAQLERHWQSLRDGLSIPRRAAVDPNVIHAALPWTFVMHRVAPGVARVRVAGQRLHDVLLMDPRGMPVSAFFAADDRSTLAVHLEEVFSEPALVQIPLHRPASLLRPQVTGALLMLPLLDQHGEVTRAIGALVTDRPIGQRRRIRIDGRQPIRHEPIALFQAPEPPETQRPNVIRPALRLVVNNG